MRHFAALFLLLTTFSFGLVVHEPSEDIPLLIINVGFVGNGSGVYLENGYVITNSHVGCHVFVDSNNVKHQPDYDSWYIIKNEDGSETDIALFKIKDYENFKQLKIVEKVNEGQEVLLIGTGYGAGQPLFLNGRFLLGYYVDYSRKIRFGFNNINLIQEPIKVLNYKTYIFKSVFGKKLNNSQAAPGDSGGAALTFDKNSGSYKLAGLMSAVSVSGSSVMFGSETYYINLFKYKKEIEKVIN